MFEIYLSLGSNAGNRFLNVMKTLILLEQSPQISIDKVSSIYKTEPYGYKDQKEFLNLVVKISSNLVPKELFCCLKNIELEVGRVLRDRWHEREIDIDILFFGDEKIDDGTIVIPHPDLQNRRFVLQPLCEINNKYRHPVIGKSAQEMLAELKDNLIVERLN